MGGCDSGPALQDYINIELDNHRNQLIRVCPLYCLSKACMQAGFLLSPLCHFMGRNAAAVL